MWTTHVIRRKSSPCELQWAEWVQRWEAQPQNLPWALAHDVWQHIVACRGYFSGPTFLVLAEISLDRGVPPLLKYTLVAWLPRPWDLRLVARAFATVPPRCAGCRPKWSSHWPLYMVCAQHHNVARHCIRRSYVQPCQPTVRYDPEDGFVVIHAEEDDGLVFEARRWSELPMQIPVLTRVTGC